jgi:four helix bundle protein
VGSQRLVSLGGAEVKNATTFLETALASQMKRAVISVPSNIAEGHSRNHRAEYRQFVFVSIGSLAEGETQLIIARELALVTGDDLAPALVRVDRLRGMLLTLGRKL